MHLPQGFPCLFLLVGHGHGLPACLFGDLVIYLVG